MESPQFYLAEVTHDGMALERVPEEVKNFTHCMTAVLNNGRALQYVPDELKIKDDNLCINLAILNDGMALQYVPEELKTQALCLAAVLNDGKALQYVPDETKAEDASLCINFAILSDGMALQYVPEELKNPELCLVAVQNDGIALYYVPDKLKTPHICLAAVQNTGSALQDAPDELKTPELCLAAVQNDGEALQYVPEELKKSVISFVAAQNDIPEDDRTPEICLAAVLNDGMALQYVPEELKILNICLAAIQNTGSALQYVPEGVKTVEICLAAVMNNREAFQYVPEEFRKIGFFSSISSIDTMKNIDIDILKNVDFPNDEDENITLQNDLLRFDFRKVRWGMTKEEVLEIENGLLISQDSDEIKYKSKFAGIEVSLLYSFNNDILYRAVYHFYDHNNDIDNCTEIYIKFKLQIVNKYGDAKFSNDKKNNSIVSMWNNGTTQIVLMLGDHGDIIMVSVMYSDVTREEESMLF